MLAACSATRVLSTLAGLSLLVSCMSPRYASLASNPLVLPSANPVDLPPQPDHVFEAVNDSGAPVRVALDEFGNRASRHVVILVPDITVDAETWSAVTKALAPDHRLIELSLLPAQEGESWLDTWLRPDGYTPERASRAMREALEAHLATDATVERITFVGGPLGTLFALSLTNKELNPAFGRRDRIDRVVTFFDMPGNLTDVVALDTVGGVDVVGVSPDALLDDRSRRSAFEDSMEELRFAPLRKALRRLRDLPGNEDLLHRKKRQVRDTDR